jgi:hypothetical protein
VDVLEEAGDLRCRPRLRPLAAGARRVRGLGGIAGDPVPPYGVAEGSVANRVHKANRGRCQTAVLELAVEGVQVRP